ncbi:hypothetical protein [Streptomyces hesseae]|uniref:Transglycosylase SLT domain-containing protein n=1 Tax=Streptomyces hesseae TaxID=3075519 RepID=A0ABU2SSA2_9ACTN|nr:hypothetical protein [Streptomyces sp. DSM 40473]MDT0451872.1 hypothetical protein [Streptomyces sp. DSM 40473]
MAIVVGSVEVQVIPNTRGIGQRLRTALAEPATSAGQEAGRLAGRAFTQAMTAGVGGGAQIGTTLGRDIAAALVPAIRNAIPDAVRQGGTRARRDATREGSETGGAFARSLKTRLEAAFRTLPKITIGADTDEADADLQALRVRMEALAGKTVGVDIDATAARAEAEALEAELLRLGAAHPDVTVRADTAAARAHLAAVREEIDRITARPGVIRLETDGGFGGRLRAQVQAAQAALPEINISADTAPARAELAALRAQLTTLATARIGIDVDAGAAMAQIDTVQARLAALSASDADIDVRVDAAQASAALAAVRAQADALDGKRIDFDFSPALLGTLGLTLALAGLAAVPGAEILAGQVAGLAAATVVAASGFAVLGAVAAPAIIGIAQALQAKKAAEDAATQASDNGARAATAATQRAAQQESAVRALAAAQRNAADQIAAAHRQVAQAEDGVRRAEQQLTRAQDDERRAQQALTSARADAVRQLEDLTDQLADSALNERAATLRLTQAKQDLAKVRADPAASQLERDQAQLTYDQAVQGLKEQSLAHKRLEADTRKANAAGVDGADGVRRAQDAAAQAHERVADQARAVADAQAGVGDAVRNVAKAQAAAADAIANAERQVAAAQMQTADATSAADTAAQKYRRALDALSPSARDTFDAFVALKSAFKDWSAALQPEVMPLFTRGLNGARASLPAFTPLVREAAAGTRELMDATAADFKTPFWNRFRDDLTHAIRPAIRNTGIALGYFFKGFAGALDAALPHTESFTQRLVDQAKRFSEWGDRLRDSPGFAAFLARIRENGPIVGGILRDIGTTLGNVWTAMAPMSGVTLLFVGDLARLVSLVPPGVLEAIGVALITVSLGLRAVALAEWLVNGATAALALLVQATPIGWTMDVILLVIGALVALGLAVVYLWQRFGWFRDGVMAVWDAIKAACLVAWATVIQPVFGWIAGIVMGQVVPAFMWLWNSTLSPFFAWISVQFSTIWATVIQPAFSWLADVIMVRVAPAVLWLWQNAFLPAFQMIGQVVSAVWFGVLQPVLLALWSVIANTLFPIVRDFAMVVVWPMFQLIGQVIKTVWLDVIWPTLQLFWSFIKNILWPVIVLLYDAVVKPTFDLIGAAIVVAWSYVIRPAVDAFAWFLKNVLGPTISWLYNSIVKPVWRWISDAIVWGWENAIQPAFSALKDGISSISSAFAHAKDGIAVAWKKIEGATKDPINFVIGTVWNSGVLDIWNTLTGWIPGIGDKLKMEKLPLLAAGGPLPVRPGVFNQPTAIVGEGNPRYPEYVIPTDPRYRARALGLLQAAGTQMLAKGGVLGSALDWGKESAGKAWDWTSDKATKAWRGVKGAADMLANPGQAMDALLKPVLGDLDSLDAAKWSQMIGEVFRTPVTGLKDTVTDFVKGFFSAGGSPQMGGDTGGSGVTRWTPQVLQALSMLGQPASWLDTVLRRMNDESGGNPDIVNTWDINWQDGTPSVGLMQVIGPTFDAYAGPFRDVGPFLYGTSVNPLANIYSGLNYALHRYGSLSALDRPGGYDSGGYLPPGLSLVYNGLGRPEPVFTPAQWDLIADSKGLAPSTETGPTTGAAPVIHLHAVPGIPTEQQIVSALKFADALYA